MSESIKDEYDTLLGKIYPMSLPLIPFGDYKITRLIVGGNPFCGNSHFSHELDAKMSRYYKEEKVVEILKRCESEGINTIQARGDYHRILYWLEFFRRGGGKLHWIAQTASEMHDVYQNIRVIASAGAIGIYHHGTQTDKLWQQGKIDQVQDYLKCMRDCNVQVGLGTHIPEVITYAEENGWDVDFYMACAYNISRLPRESAIVSGIERSYDDLFLDEDREKMCKVIRNTSKTCLLFKILAASRNCATQQDVKDAFKYAFSNIKESDAVVVGMFPENEDQIALNVGYTQTICG